MDKKEHSSGKIVKNTIWYTLAVVVQKVISFTYFYLLSSRLAPDVFGLYIWVLSIVSLASVATDFGLLQLLTREAAQHDNEAIPLARTTLALKLPLLAATLVIMWIIMLARPQEAIVYQLLIPASFILVFDTVSTVFYALFRARQLVWVESIAIVLFQSIVFVLGLIVLFNTRDITHLMAVLAIAAGINAIFLFSVGTRMFKRIVHPQFHKGRAQHMIRHAPAFAFSTIFQKIYTVADTVLLGHMNGPRSVGLYAIPSKVTTALQTLIPGAFATAIYPSMANYAKYSREKLAILFEKTVSYLLVFAIPMTVGLFALATVILQTIWPEYIEVRLSFLVMILSIPAVFLTYPTGSLLNAVGREKRNSINRGVVTAFNLAANIVLIPKIGVLGAASAFFMSTLLLFVLDFAATVQYIKTRLRELGWITLRILISSTIMAGILIYVRESTSLVLSVLLGFVAYAIAIFLLRVVGVDDWREFRRLTKRSNS